MACTLALFTIEKTERHEHVKWMTGVVGVRRIPLGEKAMTLTRFFQASVPVSVSVCLEGRRDGPSKAGIVDLCELCRLATSSPLPSLPMDL